MKGLSLPINVIVIIAIAILVLVVLAAFFGLNFGLSSQTIAREQALDRACRELRDLNNCAVTWNDVTVQHQEAGDLNPKNYKLSELCPKAGFETDADCKKRCGCSNP